MHTITRDAALRMLERDEVTYDDKAGVTLEDFYHGDTLDYRERREYDPAGRLTLAERLLPDGQPDPASLERRRYDAQGRLAEVDTALTRTSYDRDPAGRWVLATHGDLTPRPLLTERDRYTAAGILEWQYLYSPDGKIGEKTYFGYDGHNMLTARSIATGGTLRRLARVTVDYDPAANWLRQQTMFLHLGDLRLQEQEASIRMRTITYYAG